MAGNKQRFDTNSRGIGEAIDFMRAELADKKLKGSNFTRLMLVCEESLVRLVEHRSDDSSCAEISVNRFLGNVSISISVPGDEFDFIDSVEIAPDLEGDGIDEDGQDMIRSLILKAYTDEWKYSNKRGKNTVKLTVIRSGRTHLYMTLGALIAAVITGIIMSSALPESTNSALNYYLFVPVTTVYMNALKMVVAPVVFFSIVSCITQFTNISELGRIGGKLISLYLVTTVLAVCVGISMFFIFSPGDASMAGKLASDAGGIASGDVSVSFKDLIVNIVPSNFVMPFLEANMLQLIFLAVIVGVAVSMIGDHARILTVFFEAMNDVFLQVTMLIIRVMPVAVFCSIMSMILTMGIGSVVSVLGIFGTFLAGLACMIPVYCIVMILLGRLNPLPFLRKYAPVMLQTFAMSSSSASIPVNMEACESMGVSRRVYSLSIPLGATLNMHGSCIYLSVFTLALARSYGIEITGALLLSVAISIIVLSVGAPGIPGSGLICLSVLLTQINVPVAAISLVMGIDALLSMFRTMSNCLGDAAVSCTVASSEGLLDRTKYEPGARVS